MRISVAEAREVFGLTLRDVIHASKGFPYVTPCGCYVLAFIPGASIQDQWVFDVRDVPNDHA